MPAAVDDLANRFGLLAAEFRQFQDLSEPEDGVERRPEVVAHVREKFVFSPRRALGLEPRELQLIVRTLPLRHVVRDATDGVHLARRVAERKFARRQHAHPFGLQRDLFELDRPPLGGHAPIVGAIEVCESRREDVVVGFSEQVFAGASKQLFHSAVHEEVATSGVFHVNRSRTVIENRLQALLRLPELGFAPPERFIHDPQFGGPLVDAALELRIQRAHLFFGPLALRAFGSFPARAPHGLGQPGNPVLEHVIGRALFQTIDRQLLAERTRQEDERRLRAHAPRDRLRGEAVEGRQRVIRENDVECVAEQRRLECLARIDAADLALQPVRHERRFRELSIPWIVLEVQDLERSSRRSIPYGGRVERCRHSSHRAGGNSLSTAQNPPSSFTASMNAWKSTGFTTYAFTPRS